MCPRHSSSTQTHTDRAHVQREQRASANPMWTYGIFFLSVCLDMSVLLFSSFCFWECLCCCCSPSFSPGSVITRVFQKRGEGGREREKGERQKERGGRGIWWRRGNEDRWNQEIQRCESERRNYKNVMYEKHRGKDGYEKIKCKLVSGNRRSRGPSLALSLYMLFLEVAPLQIKALNQDLSKSRMLRATSFTPNKRHTGAHTHRHTHTMIMCLHQTWGELCKSYSSCLIYSYHVLINSGLFQMAIFKPLR